MSIKVTTIGFTQTTAQDFFSRISKSSVKKVIDVRLNNSSQLAGFAKARDLKFFLKEIGGVEYVHTPILAPTQKILSSYKKEKGEWRDYEERFIRLIADRRIEDRLRPEDLDGACLLCSEAEAHCCHRRLVVEYLNEKWHGALDIRHL